MRHIGVSINEFKLYEMKKVFKVVGLLVLALLLALFLAPFLFEGKIVNRVKQEINSNLNATVDFDDINLSFFKGFPYPSLTVSDVTVSGASPHEVQQLAKIEEIYVKIGLASVLHTDEPIEIISVSLNKPEFLVYTALDGTTNTSILPSSNDSSKGSYSLDIQSYKINEASVKYIDLQGKTTAVLTGINHSGKGDFSNDIFTLETDTDITSISIESNNVRLAKDLHIKSELPLQVNLTDNSYQFTDGLILLNQFKLNADGMITVLDKGMDINLTSKANNNSIREFLSLIPYAYTKDFDGVDASGKFDYQVNIKGLYANDGSRIPSFDLTANIDNAKVKYPDLALPIEDINLSLKATNTLGQIDKTDITIAPLHFQIDGEPFDASFNQIQSRESAFDVMLKTDMDISKIAKAWPIENVETLTGRLNLDMISSGTNDDLANQKLDKLKSEGVIELSDFEFKTTGSEPILVNRLEGTFKEDVLNLKEFGFSSGGNDLNGTGTFSNVLDYYFNSSKLSGELDINSAFMNLNKYIEVPTDVAEATVPFLDSFDNLDITLNYEADSLIYDVYELNNVTMKGSFSNDDISIRKATGVNGKSDFEITGNMSNVYNYLYAEESMDGKLDINAGNIFYEDFVEETTTADGTVEEVPLIPKNLDIAINVKADQIHYEKITISNSVATLDVLANRVNITDFKGKTFGGNLGLSGYYDTENPESPLFGLRYNMAGMEVVEAIKSNKTFKILAPIAEFIEGTFNSTLVLEGLLEQDLMPDFNTLSGTGFLETLEGKLKGYQPVEELKSYLNISDQKEWFLKGSKNWFEIKDGALQVKEFDYAVKDIPMKISGTHRFNLDMDYLIKASIPKKYIEATELGKAASKEFDEILAQVNKTGLDIKSSNYVDADIRLTGNVRNPKIEVINVRIADKPLTEQVKDQVKEKIDEKKAEIRDTVTTKINETVTTIRDTVQTKAEELKDTLQIKAEEIIDSTKQRAKEIVFAQVDTLLTNKLPDSTVISIKDKATEILGRTPEISIDSILIKIKDPFKLKKKINGF